MLPSRTGGVGGGLFPSQGSSVECANPRSYFLPCNLIHFMLALVLEVLEERLIVADAVDGVGQSVDIPIVDLDAVVENLGAAGLFRDDGWRTTLHGLKRRDAERLGYRRHDVDIGGF